MADTVHVRKPDDAKHGHVLRVSSESFTDGADIPMKNVFTGCGGENVSPQLSWSGAPEGTKSYAVTCFDPDAPTGSGFWHWLVFNIPASVTSFDAGKPTGDNGHTDFGMNSYGGPCPPKGHGKHRYIFTVYALDVEKLDGVSSKTTGAPLVFNMRGHVLATGHVMGTFGH